MAKTIYKTRTEFVFDEIKTQILSGNLKSKTPLRQESLAEEFNVSRIPIREALLQLEAQGLVKFIAHKGAVVTELSIHEIDELFQLRAVLEPYILEHAIKNLDKQTISDTEKISDKLMHTPPEHKDTDAFIQLNHKFYNCLYAAAKLPHAQEMLAILNLRSNRYIRMQLLHLQTDITAQAKKTPKLLLQHCKDKNITAAKQLLEQYILATGIKLKRFLTESSLRKE